ncbi:MAG TPA: tudor domain-containing protein [Pyrinomonadaceae bacterium]
MKRFWGVILCAVVLAACANVCAAQTRKWKVGDRALVHWSQDEFWYPATITGVSRSRYYIVFDDGDEEWTTRSRIAPLKLTVGRRVFVNRKHEGNYYPGRIIASRRGNIITILYDDRIRETTTVSGVRVKLR